MLEKVVNGIRHVVNVDTFGNMRVQIMFDKPGKTDQSFKKDCDVNLMVKRFMKINKMDLTKFNSYMSSVSPSYDPSAQVVNGVVPDYEYHLNAQVEAQNMFMSLPSEIRTRFDNQPGKFLSFVFDKNNSDELVRMGLLKQKVVNSDATVLGSSPSETK